MYAVGCDQFVFVFLQLQMEMLILTKTSQFKSMYTEESKMSFYFWFSSFLALSLDIFYVIAAFIKT